MFEGTLVVYPDRIFQYPSGDGEGREEAVWKGSPNRSGKRPLGEWGRAVGPEPT